MSDFWFGMSMALIGLNIGFGFGAMIGHTVTEFRQKTGRDGEGIRR